MKEELSRQKEQEYSDRFDRGLRNAQDAEEERLFKAYRCIQEGFHTLHVPAIVPERVIDNLLSHASPKKSKRNFFGLINDIPTPIFVSGYGVLLFLCLFSLYIVIQTPDVLPVRQITFQSTEQTENRSVPYLWERRIQQGNRVTVPANVSATLHLADGSILSCSPETQIAIHYRTHREIEILSGAVTVHAAKQPESNMIVNTPLGQVRVIGTIFHIELQ